MRHRFPRIDMQSLRPRCAGPPASRRSLAHAICAAHAPPDLDRPDGGRRTREVSAARRGGAEEDDRQARAGGSRSRHFQAAPARARRARQDGGGGADHGPALSAPELVGQRDALLHARAGQVAPRPGAAACVLPEQGPVGPHRPEPAVHPWCAGGEATSGNFYPAGATKADVERWMKSLPEARRRQAAGFYTTIRRDAAGKFHIVPYSVEYQGELSRAAALLREAAQLADEPTLRDFLSKRADAFLSNDYSASDVAWMKLDASIEPTIGPYEVYDDEWFNAKAGFDAFVAVRDDP